MCCQGAGFDFCDEDRSNGFRFLGTLSRNISSWRRQANIKRVSIPAWPDPIAKGIIMMRASQAEKAERFRALHARPGAFVIPNPWDAGSARILAGLGFEALTTTSAGLAFTLGRRDGAVTRDEALANARAIVEATDLPVAADLENGYGHTPERVAETIRLAGQVAGLVGGSIEDATGDPGQPIYDFQHAVERVAAAAEAAHALPFPFAFVGRAENFLHGRPDLDDTIRRLQAFEAVGADVLYAPGLTKAEDIRTVCAAVGKSVNALMGLKGASFAVVELAALGVRRISVGSALSRAALGAFVRAAREIREHGTFAFADEAITYAEANKLMSGP
jgi:2-methylisocitrate lyase-like PEP mutase family enzyme